MNATLKFPGGAAAIQQPSRDALLLSAKQWTQAAKERAAESLASGCREGADMAYILGCLGHVLRILDEVKQ